MGLLGQNWDDPQSSAIMQLAGGLLSGNFGQGAAAYGVTMAGAKDAAMKRQYMQSQMDNLSSEIEARKLAAVKDARQQANLEKFMNGDGNAEAMSAGAFSPSSDGRGPVMPMSAPQAQQGVQGGAMAYGRSIGIPEKALQADMVFNGGKGIAEMMFKRGAPNMKVANGFAYDENTLPGGFMPFMNTSASGQTTMGRPGLDGEMVVSAPQGALETVGNYKRVENGQTPKEVFNPSTGRKEFATVQQVIDAAQGPGQWIGQEPKGNFSGNPQQILSEIGRIGDPTYRAEAMRAFQTQMRGGAGGNMAAGPSLEADAQAKANETRMVDSSKAGTARVMTGYDNARSASDSILSNVEARNSMAGGVFVGAGAETKLAISKSLQTLGFNVAPDKVSNTEYLQSTLGQGILNKAKTLGANPTDSDARIIRGIVGSIGTDPNALTKLLDYQDVMSRRAIDDHNKNYGDAKTRGFDAGFDLMVKPPGAPETAKPPGKMVDALPTPNASNKGQRIRDTATGKILTSNGLQWKAE